MIAELRKYRIYGIALFDLVFGIIGMILLFLLLRKIYFPNLSYGPFVLWAIILTIPIGIFFHVFFGVNTALNSYLKLSNKR